MFLFQQYYNNMKQDKNSYLFYIIKCAFKNLVASNVSNGKF